MRRTASPYPPIEPYEEGRLDVGDGHRIHWEVCGNPAGKPAVVLHGGPGSGSTPGFRRLFDPRAYRIILFDQRGCGRSTPHTSDPSVDLSTNTTHHLLADLERLRQHLAVGRWLVFGVSWGSTLALAHAQSHPEWVSEAVLLCVTTTRRSEIEWLYRGVASFFPREWERFVSGAPAAEREGDLVAAYNRLLEDPRPSVRARAADDWTAWELAVMSLQPEPELPHAWRDPAFRLARARIVTHYFRHGAWLEDGVLLRNAGMLAGVPSVLIHGRLDLGGPLATAWNLARRWPGSELVVEGAGHRVTDPGMSERVVEATDRFAARP